MLSLKNVSVLEKKTNQAIVNNVSIEVRAGDFLVVGGQNDVERELLVSLIGTMDLASKGEVYVEGIELTKYTPVQIVSLRREKFGFMLNNCELDENLSVG